MNFLAKTVASLESRIDSALLGEQQAAQAQLQNGGIRPSSAASIKRDADQTEQATPPPRTGTPSSGKLSMQERLAAAMARSASPALKSSTASPRSSIDVTRGSIDKRRDAPSRTGTPRPDEDGDKTVKDDASEAAKVSPKTDGDGAAVEGTEAKPESETENLVVQVSSPPIELPPAASPNASTDLQSPASANNANDTTSPANDSLAMKDALITQLQNDLVTCEMRRQEEAQAASERIDALESKIKQLEDQEAQRSASGTTNGVDKKLAEKDEKIALLLEEGERLSKLELNHMTIIKKLRSKANEDEKVTFNLKQKLEKAEKEAVDLKDKLKKAADTEKELNKKLKGYTKVDSELEKLRRDKVERDELVSSLKEQLEFANTRANDAEARAQSEALHAEKKTTAELRDKIKALEVEIAQAAKQSESTIATYTFKLKKAEENALKAETDLRAEMAVMERKMEILRARAEEVSSGASGDMHSQLLRQVETLQTQYAVASENWRGIESTLSARMAAVERERDQLVKTEADVRRKAREINAQAKKFESDLEMALTKNRYLTEDLESEKQRVEQLQKKLVTLEMEVERSRKALENAKDEFSRELAQKLQESKVKWQEEAAAHRSPSPKPSYRSGRTYNALDGTGFSPMLRQDSFPLSDYDSSAVEGRGSRTSFASPPPRQDSALSLPHFAHHQPSSRAVSGSTSSRPISRDHDEDDAYFSAHHQPPAISPRNGNTRNNSIVNTTNLPFSNVLSPTIATPATPSVRNPSEVPDLVSVSTVAAGPSVQLVSRLSAAVRRLETDMAAARDELARMAASRDDARAELVELMREVDAKRDLEAQLAKMQQEKEELTEKFHAALEELGEKMERLDELEDQVGDLKKMYRELLLRNS